MCAQPIEATLLALALFIASGRLIPRLVSLQRLNVSDWFLVASLLDAIGLFITDFMTYKWGGMGDENSPDPSDPQRIALKKVRNPAKEYWARRSG